MILSEQINANKIQYNKDVINELIIYRFFSVFLKEIGRNKLRFDGALITSVSSSKEARSNERS